MAVSDAGRFIRNAPNRLVFPILDIDNRPYSGGESASPDSEVSSNGDAFVDCTNEIQEIGSSGIYSLDSTEEECTGDQIVYKINIAGPSGLQDRAVIPDIVPALDSGVARGGSLSTITLRTVASAVDDYYNHAVIEIARGAGAGQFRTILSYNGSSQVATVTKPWLVAPDSSSVYVIHHAASDVNVKWIDDDSTAATLFKSLYQGGLVAGAISDSSPTDTGFKGDSGFSSDDDFYNGQLLVMTGGSLSGDAKRILDYDGASRLITLVGALSGTPADGDAFVILGRII